MNAAAIPRHVCDDVRILHQSSSNIATITYCVMPDCPRYAKESALCLEHGRHHRWTSTRSALPTAWTPLPPPRQFTDRRSTTGPQNRNARCRHMGCSSYARNGGFCTRHGGGRKCLMVDCVTPSQTGGLCRLHGGGTRCKLAGCARFARVQGLCSTHFKGITSDSTAGQSSRETVDRPRHDEAS
ncbi:Aste57867_22057 [Aphanomyces stellatus]|uniref:Aste57867_22057 protein n=1 Tax=Aphanomyces stellatus TaxID=120398 RepID=A0A485LJW4_9STRA|nr:hypothetical protein As57867_021988 [Aphanomyces stellatus]VFT98725.1 Aste57867_22057 [Aphanomyces stellatus]